MFFHLRENVKMKVYYECTSHISPSGTSLSTLNQVESVQSNCMWWSCWFGASALCEAISDTEINGIFKLCDRVFVQAPGLRAAGVTCRGRGTSSLWPTLLLSWGIGWLPCPLCTQVRGYWVNMTETCLHMTFFTMSQPFFIKSSENYRNLMGLILLNAYGIKRFFFPVDNSHRSNGCERHQYIPHGFPAGHTGRHGPHPPLFALPSALLLQVCVIHNLLSICTFFQ